MPLLQATNIHKKFEQPDSLPINALNGASLEVNPGELVAIVGPSGSGKSTFMHCMAGIETVTSGTVTAVGQEITAMKKGALARFRRDNIGLIFQAYNLVPSLNALENVALPARLARRRLSNKDASIALGRVGLEDRGAAFPAQLSGGQQQRVAIARVLATRPQIVFADEPTGALDSSNGGEVLSLLRALSSGERAVVLVTHDLQAAATADRVYVMKAGTVSDVLNAPSLAQIFEASVGPSQSSITPGA